MIEIKSLTFEDRETTFKYVCALLAELRETPDEDADVDRNKVAEDWLTNQDRHTVFVALDENRPVGVITLSECFAIYANGNYGIINELYVKPGYRSKGVGKMLVDEVIRIARDKGWYRVDVTAPFGDKWKRTVDFYLREGFVHTGPKLKFIV